LSYQYFGVQDLSWAVDTTLPVFDQCSKNGACVQTLSNKTIRLINIDELETAINDIQSTVSPDTMPLS
jgi:hypothetical protein